MKQIHLFLIYLVLSVAAVICFVRGSTPPEHVYVVCKEEKNLPSQCLSFTGHEVVSCHTDELSALQSADSYNRAIHDKKYFVLKHKARNAK